MKIILNDIIIIGPIELVVKISGFLDEYISRVATDSTDIIYKSKSDTNLIEFLRKFNIYKTGTTTTNSNTYDTYSPIDETEEWQPLQQH